jgi:Transposase, Mutator family
VWSVLVVVLEPVWQCGGEPLGETSATPSGILDRMPDEIRRKLPYEVVDELLAGARTEEEIVGPGGLLSQLTKQLVERAMEDELSDHVGYDRRQEPQGGTGNTRNGSTSKTSITEPGRVRIDTPRDRDGSFAPPAAYCAGSQHATLRRRRRLLPPPPCLPRVESVRRIVPPPTAAPALRA